jgi:cytochrome c peroxidase
MPTAIVVARGTTVAVINDDTRPHNVRIFDQRFSFNSGLQEPGNKARNTPPQAGTYEAFCGIHHSMLPIIEAQ